VIGVNAGSGQRCFDRTKGWINLDIQARKHPDVGDTKYPDIVCDMKTMPFGNGSVDIVVSSHTLEHLRCGEADGFIKEAYRVLKPGGSFIIALPDIRALAQRWLTRQISDFIFIINMMGAYIESDHDHHKWHYTRESLYELLNNSGTWDIKRFNNRQIPGMDLAIDWWIMITEATKKLA
jgi:predicted SAM-dependent methyltransferase